MHLYQVLQFLIQTALLALDPVLARQLTSFISLVFRTWHQEAALMLYLLMFLARRAIADEAEHLLVASTHQGIEAHDAVIISIGSTLAIFLHWTSFIFAVLVIYEPELTHRLSWFRTHRGVAALRHAAFIGAPVETDIFLIIICRCVFLLIKVLVILNELVWDEEEVPIIERCVITRSITISGWMILWLWGAALLADILLLFHLLGSDRPHLEQGKLEWALKFLVELNVKHVPDLRLNHAVFKPIVVVKVYWVFLDVVLPVGVHVDFLEEVRVKILITAFRFDVIQVENRFIQGLDLCPLSLLLRLHFFLLENFSNLLVLQDTLRKQASINGTVFVDGCVCVTKRCRSPERFIDAVFLVSVCIVVWALLAAFFGGN